MTKQEFFQKYYGCKPDEFNLHKGFSSLCRNHSDDIEIWFDDKVLDSYNYPWFLCEYCLDKFKIWYNPDKFNWANIHYLERFCQEYKNI